MSDSPPLPHESAPLREGVVAVILREDRFLVIRRSQHVVAPGAYCFPGGGLEPGESEPQALEREMQEELGAVIRPLRRVWRSTTPWRVSLAWWLAELDESATLKANPLEVESICWANVAEMRELVGLLVSNHEFLDALARCEINLHPPADGTCD